MKTDVFISEHGKQSLILESYVSVYAQYRKAKRFEINWFGTYSILFSNISAVRPRLPLHFRNSYGLPLGETLTKSVRTVKMRCCTTYYSNTINPACPFSHAIWPSGAMETGPVSTPSFTKNTRFYRKKSSEWTVATIRHLLRFDEVTFNFLFIV